MRTAYLRLNKNDVSEGTVPISPGPSGKLTVKDLIQELVESEAIPKNAKTTVRLPRFVPIDPGSRHTHVGGQWVPSGDSGDCMGLTNDRLHDGDLIVADQPYGPSNKESIKLYLPPTTLYLMCCRRQSRVVYHSNLKDHQFI